MNGYVSTNVAPAVKGVKTLLLAQPPRGVITDPRVLVDAPYPLTSAGLGDVLAKGVSITDWYLNYLLFGDYYCERSANMIADMERLYLNHPEGLPLKIPDAMEGLFRALILSGVSMNMVGTSLPASGGEHLISHTLDLLSSIERCEHDLHGRQVGVATVLAAELYRRVLSMESPTLSEPHEIRQDTLWGPYADTVKRFYAQKVSRLREAREKLLRKNGWDQLREGLLSRLDPPERIQGCLRSAAGATRAEDILCSRERLSLAFRHAHEIRSHFTILDLAYLVGLMPGAASEIVEAWA
jgi:glycerol-1-phosphate dehydrogenase [NAD(P)+]